MKTNRKKGIQPESNSKLHQVKSLPNYYNNNTVNSTNEGLARKLIIWKLPYPRFSSGQVVQPRLTDKMVGQFWAKTESLTSFNSKKAVILINMAIDDTNGYTEALKTELFTFKQIIETAITGCQRTLNSLSNRLQLFGQSATIDGDFVRNNFLQLDIFYGELKYVSVEQSVAYDASSLLSDIGGFLGLCIGGTVITVFEVIDAVVYNAYLKIRYGNRPVSTPVSPLSPA